jgi:hypothetical protein
MTSEYIPRYNLIINKIEKIIKRDDQIEWEIYENNIEIITINNSKMKTWINPDILYWKTHLGKDWIPEKK